MGFEIDGLERESVLEIPVLRAYADGSTYGEKTIARAIDHTTAFYEPSASSSGSTKEEDSDPDEGDPRSRDRELLYLKEKYRLSRAQVATLESQLDAKRERIALLERRLTQVEGRSSARREPPDVSRETQSGTGVFEWVRGLLER